MSAALSPTNTSSLVVSPVRAEDFAVAWRLLEEYFAAVKVVVRDDRDTVLQQLDHHCNGLWVAYSQGEAAGCIALRALPSQRNVRAEIKRLWVRPQFRRLGIASSLLSALESHARLMKIDDLYLDTKDDLREAIAFYKQRGYESCERYNTNPQATLFLRKSLTFPLIVRDFRAGDEGAFWSLNEAWISKLFKLETKDIQTLKEPQKYILSKGGRIYVACRGDATLGCCALLNMGDDSYEVAKMGVAESERGKGVGRTLLEYIVADARRLGCRRLYLETNHILVNAIHLYESVGFVRLKPEDVKPSPYARSDVQMEMILN